jgi:hypothetical protein
VFGGRDPQPQRPANALGRQISLGAMKVLINLPFHQIN